MSKGACEKDAATLGDTTPKDLAMQRDLFTENRLDKEDAESIAMLIAQKRHEEEQRCVGGAVCVCVCVCATRALLCSFSVSSVFPLY